MLMRDLGTPVLPPVSNDVDRPIRVGLGHPAAHGAAAQPLVLEEAEAVQVVVGVDLPARIPVELPRIFQPERAAGLRVEVPLDHLPRPGIQRLARNFGLGQQVGFNLYGHDFLSVVRLREESSKEGESGRSAARKGLLRTSA